MVFVGLKDVATLAHFISSQGSRRGRTEVTEGESDTLLRTASPGIPNKKTNTVGQLWGCGGGAILG